MAWKSKDSFSIVALTEEFASASSAAAIAAAEAARVDIDKLKTSEKRERIGTTSESRILQQRKQSESRILQLGAYNPDDQSVQIPVKALGYRSEMKLYYKVQ